MVAKVAPTSTVAPASALMALKHAGCRGVDFQGHLVGLELRPGARRRRRRRRPPSAIGRCCPSVTDSPRTGTTTSTAARRPSPPARPPQRPPGAGAGSGSGAGAGAGSGGRWRCRRGSGAVDAAEQRADLDVLAFASTRISLTDAGRAGVDLEGHLVGFQLDQRLVLGNRIAGLLQPLRDGRLADRFTEGGDHDIGCHLRLSSDVAQRLPLFGRRLGRAGAAPSSRRSWAFLRAWMRRSRFLPRVKASSISGFLLGDMTRKLPGRRRGRRGSAGVARAREAAAQTLLGHLLDEGVDEGPGAHVARLFLTPDQIAVLVGFEFHRQTHRPGRDRAAPGAGSARP